TVEIGNYLSSLEVVETLLRDRYGVPSREEDDKALAESRSEEWYFSNGRISMIYWPTGFFKTITILRLIHLTGVAVDLRDGLPSRWHALPKVPGRVPGLVSNRRRLPRLPGMVTMA
ncbi:MAG: hypothetical protein KGJ86_20160, partial [Chloroflexota bacterium]|nr:hypothetical protein [Chloroflexota bacterium]